MSARVTTKQLEKILANRPKAAGAAPLALVTPDTDRAKGFRGGDNKYGAKTVQTDDGLFHSLGEHRRWIHLKMLERAGLIANLRRQVRYRLVGENGPILVTNRNGAKRQLVYVADYVYDDLVAGDTVIEDFKGRDTRESLIKRAILRAMLTSSFRILVTH